MVAPLRVQPVPSEHPYPLRIRIVGDATTSTTHLPDPARADGSAGQWWPPVALRPGWVHEHAHEVDLVHLHFGFDASTPHELSRWCDAMDAHGIPLVFTVHDLVNPHFRDQRNHLERLQVLVSRASQLVTLTPLAAHRIATGWGRSATVIPHPHVVPLSEIGRPRPPQATFRVGLHLKSLRANVVAAPIISALVPMIERLPDARLSVHLHREVVANDHPRHDPTLLRLVTRLAEGNRLDLTVHDPHTDDELWGYLRSIDLSVLPYAFGTHSGWLEACHDLGTMALAPTTGCWTEQQPCHTFAWEPNGSPDVGALSRAIRQAYRGKGSAGVGTRRAERQSQQALVATSYERVYREAMRAMARSTHTSEPA